MLLMKRLFTFSALLVLIASCKIQNSTENAHADDAVYKLGLNPVIGAKYQYSITNETNVEMEVDEKEVTNNNRSEVGLTYTMNKDSAGNYLVRMIYNTIKLHTKAGDKETKMDAANAAATLDPVERMLGILKNAQITAVVTPTGVVKETRGYKELGEQLTAGFADHDGHSKEIALNQWEQLVGQGLIKKNMDQLFTIFPDSAVHRGDKWKLTTDGNGDFGLKSHTFYQLKAINEDIALIESEGDMESDAVTADALPGFASMTDLKGKQQGRYEMDVRTGMLRNCTITSTITGTIQVMGREVPVTIDNTVKLEGKPHTK
jgi:hypothetical protein